MQVSTDELMMLIGMKDVEIMLLKKKIAELQEQLSKLLDESQKQTQ